MIKKIFVVIWLLSLGVSAAEAKVTADKINVVATQAIFADLIKEVGGERVEVYAVASPRFNVHFIQPKPSDIKKVRMADLYVSAGLDLEAWSDPLLEAAGKPELFRGREKNLDLSLGIELLKVPHAQNTRAEGDVHLFGNPHFHMNPENGNVMAMAIAEKLKEMDPGNASSYENNLRDFQERLKAKLSEWKDLCAHCAGKEIVSYHDDMEYLAHFLGIEAHRFLEPKPGIPPTAKHLAEVEKDAIDHQVKVIVQPTYYAKDASEFMAKKIGGKVVIVCQNAGELPGTETFFSFFDKNISALSEALRG